MNQWTYKKPVIEGWYKLNQGDVVTPNNFECVKLSLDENGQLRDQHETLVNDYHNCYKFMAFDFDTLNKIGNE